jgi:hypothetical protein
LLALLAGACAGEGGPEVDSRQAELERCAETPGVLCTWAGTGRLAFNGDGHALTESSFYWPIDLTIDELGTYILDWNNHRVRRLAPDLTLETVIGSDFVGDGPDDMSDLTIPGAPGTEVLLNHPTQLVPAADGSLTLVAWHNHKLRRYDPETGLVRVICGGPAGFQGDGGPATAARVNQPVQLVLAEDGTEYLLDQRNQVVRAIDRDGIISTLAGTPMMAGFEGDGGLEALGLLGTHQNQPDGKASGDADPESPVESSSLDDRRAQDPHTPDKIEPPGLVLDLVV